MNTIKNNRDYNAIAKRIEQLVDAEPETPAAYELKQHICSIITYEQSKINNGRHPHFPGHQGK